MQCLSRYNRDTLVHLCSPTDWKQKKKKKSETVSLQAYKGLALVAIRCLCELMVALPHFNFHNNILVMVAPLMNDACPEVSPARSWPLARAWVLSACQFDHVRPGGSSF